MTRPPEDPREQPQRPQQPSTRQFGPGSEAFPGEYGDTHTGPTDEYGALDPRTPQPRADDLAAPYYDQDAENAGGYYDGGRPPGGSSSRGRTVGLVLAVIAALVIVGVVAYVIFSGNEDNSTQTAGSPTTTGPSSSASEPSTPTTTTTTTTTTSPTRTTPPDLVVYQLTGNGDVIGMNYRSGGRPVIVATAGAPWSITTQVGGDTASLTAIVVRGRVTCTILRDGELLNSSTSGPGPLECRADVSR
ncbi:hypothetical protein QSJ18_00160 [Gordonia sp. ABSL1-1]|uniref:hypothetical protein n=1 Tax=Gordonia sp. ABSL1-1 TaxID=3053923 RepID=UPI0025736279|nr:hypothetical protein [Gordonia sp. ABSL1-1]MDL9935149.1 hypothetical protein [Gordonia sp. ABSL1-1]